MAMLGVKLRNFPEEGQRAWIHVDVLPGDVVKTFQDVQRGPDQVFGASPAESLLELLQRPLEVDLDEKIMRHVRDFNNDPQKVLGCTPAQAAQIKQAGYLQADVIKSLLIQESGGTKKGSKEPADDQWKKDPGTVNYPKDWDEEKRKVGLTPSNQFPSGNADNNIRATIGWFARKGFGPSGKLTPGMRFKGWRTAVENYRRSGATGYANKIFKRAENPGQYVPIEN